VFECNYEGAQDDYLDEFVGKAGPVLHEIYSHCEGFDREKKDADLRGYLESHAEKYSAFYVGCPYQSQEGIKKAVEARRIIEDFLDRQSPGGQELQQLRKAIQSHLEQNKLASLDGLITPLDKLRLRRMWNVVLAGFVVFAFAYILSLILSVRFWSALIGLVGVVVGLVAVWLIALRLQEIRESKAPEEAKRRIDPRLFHKDDRYLQNHLTT